MPDFLTWIKRNKLASALIVAIVLYLLSKGLFGISSPLDFSSNYKTPSLSYSRNMAADSAEMGLAAGSMGKIVSGIMPPSYPEPASAPQANVSSRMVVHNSQMSLVVKNVRDSVDQIINLASKAGGYMVNSNLSQPEEAPYADVSVRIPSDRLQEVLTQLRTYAIKVTYENLSGRDVTDQYLDIDTRLTRLRKTQAKFETLLDSAIDFDEILRAQQEILNIQNQIDSLVGQQQYLEQTSKLALVTINLSTDEFALPYSPSDNFRPAVIFKQAVRSLVVSLRSLLAKVIWIGVYSVIWLPALLIFIFLYRWWHRKPGQKA